MDKAIVENRQVFIPAETVYEHEFTAELPPFEAWSTWNKPKLREAKRALRQIHKALNRGDIEWFEGWANRPEDKTPVLSFGTFSRGRWHKKDNGHYGYENDKSEFQSWLYYMAERLGYEVTDQDQTSTCDGCNRAIDTGSSTPDPYHVSDGAIYCRFCADENTEAIEEYIEEGNHSLNFRPSFNSFNYDSSLMFVRFDHQTRTENFCKAYLKRQKYTSYGDTVYFYANNLEQDHSSSSPMAKAFEVTQWFPVKASYVERHGQRWIKDNNGHGYVSSQGLENQFKFLHLTQESNPLLWGLIFGSILETVIFDRDITFLEETFGHKFGTDEFKAEAENRGLFLEQIDEN